MFLGDLSHDWIEDQLDKGLGCKKPANSTVLMDKLARQVNLGGFAVANHRALQNAFKKLLNRNLKK